MSPKSFKWFLYLLAYTYYYIVCWCPLESYLDSKIMCILEHPFNQSLILCHTLRERGGIVVECRTLNREVLGSIPTGVTVLCP